MPAAELDTTPMSLGTWTVVGHCHKGTVTHLAILAEDCPGVVRGQPVPVREMGPPLTSFVPRLADREDAPDLAPQETFACEQVDAHAVAWLADLDDDDREGMRDWYRDVCAMFPTSLCPRRPRVRPGEERALAEFLSQCHYIADPPFRAETDPVSGTNGTVEPCIFRVSAQSGL